MTQQEIAGKLGVSQTTVSMVLKNPNTKKVSKDKREQILNYANVTDYVPMSRNGKTGCIGYLFPASYDCTYSNFYNRFILGIEKAAQDNDYSLVIEKHLGEGTFSAYNKVEGVIVEGMGAGPLAVLQGKLPLVTLNLSFHDAFCDSVYPANEDGVAVALEYLKKMGHRRVAYFAIGVPDDLNDINHWQRLSAFRNLAPRSSFIMEDGYIQLPECEQPTIAETKRKIRETLLYWRNLPEPPTAVLCSNDEYALWMIQQAGPLGIKLPDDLSIIGMDNITPCEFSTPALTSIDHNAEEMGRLSCELLIKRIKEPERPLCKVSCNATLVIRESVADLRNCCKIKY